MAKISSPLGSQTLDSPPMRKFVVEDFETEQNSDSQSGPSFQNLSASDLEKLAREARNQKLQEEKTVSSAIKKRIEILSGLGRATKDVDIEGIVFSIRTLKSYELQETVKALSLLDNVLDTSFEARNQVLARSIYKIDGQDVSIILGSSNIEEKLKMVRELENSVAIYLHDHYVQLSKENDDKFKITSNDEQDIKEAVQDLKKSS